MLQKCIGLFIILHFKSVARPECMGHNICVSLLVE